MTAVGGPVGAREETLVHVQFLLGRLTSTLMALLALWLVYRATRLVGDRATALWAAALTAPALPLVYYAKTANLDVPYLFWFLLSALCFLRALRYGDRLAYLGLGVAAALAVSTKDQAYGLYVAMPPLLLADLARRRRLAARSGWGALGDPRLWLGAGAAAACLALVWAPAGEGELSRHLEALVSERAVGRYRLYPATLAGQWRQAIDSARYLWLAAGPATVAAALGGLGLALRRPREHRALLALAAVAAGYYVAFMVPIGYNYVRFFLPILPVAAIAAALLLRRLIALPALGGAGRIAVVAAVLAWPVARAVALDLHMLGDARYPAEAWLRAEGREEEALGVGHDRRLPRRIATVDWSRLAEAPCAPLRGAPTVVVNADEVRGHRERSALAWLASPASGLEEAARFRNRFPVGLFHRPGVQWNLNKIGREIVVYRATGRRCYDAPTVHRTLRRIRLGDDPGDRAGLAAAIEAGVVETVSLGARMSLAGVSSDRWTRGPRAAALLVRGRRRRPVLPHLEVDLPGAAGASLFVDGGGSVRRIPLTAPRTRIDLPEVAAGATALFVLWTDAAWSPEGSQRLLGVRLAPGR